MKFRVKITLCMIGLVSTLFGIGESLLLNASFDEAIDGVRDPSGCRGYQWKPDL